MKCEKALNLTFIYAIMRSMLVILFIYMCLLQRSYSYPGGAPPGACQTMTPHHTNSEPQLSPSPFSVKAENIGANIQVTIEDSTNRTPFRGFLIKAVQEDEKEITDGRFMTNQHSRALSCEGFGQEATLTHNSRTDKQSIITTWYPPNGFSGSVKFKATVAAKYTEFWTNIFSNVVSVKSQGSSVGVTPFKRTPTAPIEKTTTPVTLTSDIYSDCGLNKGCFGLPNDCVGKRSCQIILAYESNNQNQTVQFQLLGALGRNASGWIAVGLSTDDKMGDDSVTECVYFSNQLLVRESWNLGGNGVKKDNILLPDTKDIMDENIEYNDGVISCSWSRQFNTSVKGHSFNIGTDEYYLLLAKGPIDDSGNKGWHNLKGPSSRSVDLTTVELLQAKLPTFIKIHGSLMTAAWICFVSLGILMARHYKEVWNKYQLCGGKVWFSVHRFFMLLSVALMIGGFVIIFIDVGGWSETASNPHPILGCIATGLAILQPFIAAIRPSPTSPKRPIFRWVHGLVGNGAQIIAVINMFFAVTLKNSNLPQAFYWVLVTFIIYHCLVHLLIHIHSALMGREREREFNINKSAKSHHLQFTDSYDVNAESPGSDFKVFALGLYSMINIGLTIALILMIVLN